MPTAPMPVYPGLPCFTLADDKYGELVSCETQAAVSFTLKRYD